MTAYSAGAVARRLGVAVTTLRTWHQRYGLGPSLHEPGHHRRYTEQDISRLETMQRLISSGVAPGEAARWAQLDPTELPPRVTYEPDGAAVTARGLQRAALRLDPAAVHRHLAAAIRMLGVVDAWDFVIRPVLAAVGERHATTGTFVEVEHLMSGCISAVFAAVPRPDRGVPPRLLLACADEEQHSLPMEALAAALAADGVPARVLGPRVPPQALATAVHRTAPAGVLVWSHHRSTGNPAQLNGILTGRHRPLMIAAAGPGWDTSALPPEVRSPATLTEALMLLTAAAA